MAGGFAKGAAGGFIGEWEKGLNRSAGNKI